jgi:hypothetical protein
MFDLSKLIEAILGIVAFIPVYRFVLLVEVACNPGSLDTLGSQAF